MDLRDVEGDPGGLRGFSCPKCRRKMSIWVLDWHAVLHHPRMFRWQGNWLVVTGLITTALACLGIIYLGTADSAQLSLFALLTGFAGGALLIGGLDAISLRISANRAGLVGDEE